MLTNNIHISTKKKLPWPTEKTSKIIGVVWNNLKYKSQLITVDSGGYLTLFDAAQNKYLYQILASETWLTSVDIDKIEGKRVACGTMRG